MRNWNFGLAVLKIYDIPGCGVALHVNEKKETGIYTVEWNASAFASEVYFNMINSKAENVLSGIIAFPDRIVNLS